MDEFGEAFLIWSGHAALVAMLISLGFTVFRLVRGPTLSDRIVALDMLALLGIAFIGVIAVVTEEYAYLDVAIALSLVGFLATVAFARYVQHRASLDSGDNAESSQTSGESS